VVSLTGEDELVDRWNAGKYVSRKQIMDASDRQEIALRQHMVQHGVKPPGSTTDFSHKQHGRWSEFAHHRRRHMLDEVSTELRMSTFGRHPDWRARAVSVDHVGDTLLELLAIGGSPLRSTLGRPAFDQTQAAFDALMELKTRLPLAHIARGGRSGS
jgi:hypothetical protein